jgi:hypothetical protein
MMTLPLLDVPQAPWRAVCTYADSIAFDGERACARHYIERQAVVLHGVRRGGAARDAASSQRAAALGRSGIRVQAHMFGIESSWYVISDSLPQHGAYPPGS